MEHLIADSGIQFLIKEVNFNPDDPLALPNGKVLRYSFSEDINPLTKSFDILLSASTGTYISLKDVRNGGQNQDILEKQATGLEKLSMAGLPEIKTGAPTDLFPIYDENSPDVYSIKTLHNYRIGRDYAFELLLDKWLPMPMFEKLTDGTTSDAPKGWARVKIHQTEADPVKNNNRYQLIWAIDTSLSDNVLKDVKPYYYEEDAGVKDFCMCNRTEILLNYFFTSELNDFGIPEDKESGISQYIAAVLGLDQNIMNAQPHRFQYIAYYIYFVNFLRLIGAAPDIRLYDRRNADGERLSGIPVDFVLDIGNSRTCGVLFEDGDFTKAKMLSLRDLSNPEKVYNEPFDMRFVFRRADFGNALIFKNEEDIFNWKSFVRVGEEAKKLIYKSLETDGVAEKATNYSSPKRYLWDNEPFDGQWEYLVTTDDPLTLRLRDKIYIKGLSESFDEVGNVVETQTSVLFDEPKFSRSSLMTLVMIEILQQALVQINSIEFRDIHGKIDCRRYLRNIIITCPTAMPLKEQIRLRASVQEAFSVIAKSMRIPYIINVIPSPKSLNEKDEISGIRKAWSYDEASVCQLVYLYAEIVRRYSGDMKQFIDMKGHVRPEHISEGYAKKSITIGSIDIGAGTTDITICSYKYEEGGGNRISPIPLFWDSFYLAGDDILKNIIRNIIIDGPIKGNSSLGSIRNALESRMLDMTDEELSNLPSAKESPVYHNKLNNILSAPDKITRDNHIRTYASILLHDYFGFDSNMMSYKDRECRRDFNTQISVPLAQFMMELLRLNRSSKIYSFRDIFSQNIPSKYLLDHFEKHFGFRFEDIEWRFDPQEVSDMVKTTMEPLMKQLSIVLYKYKCDILVLAGRPTSLDCITELFIKYYPLSPDRLIRLNEYMVGSWYPFADGQGYFYDQKSVVAVGAMIAYIASTTGFNGLILDFDEMKRKMESTANYVGIYNAKRQQVEYVLLSPSVSDAEFQISVFPAYIGCKQFEASIYQARPLYAIFNDSGRQALKIRISRDYREDKEALQIDSVMDINNDDVPVSDVKLRQQSMADEGAYWQDKGEFELSI